MSDDPKLLPVVGRTSSAATTAFCAEKLEGPGGFIWLDGNGKITAGNGTLDAPKPNAFSLLPGNSDARREHCPGSTAICRASCYVHGLEAAAAETFKLYAHNSAMLAEILSFPEVRQLEWASLLADWITANAPGGFRWHVSGDVTSESHAIWIAQAALMSGSVQHWIYTRSFDHVEALTAVDNLSLNLSCDAENYERARSVRVAAMHCFGSTPRLCYLTTDGNVPADLPEGSVIFADYALRWAPGSPAPSWLDALTSAQRRGVCPTDLRGKSEQRRCGPCSMCIDPTAVSWDHLVRA